MLPMLATTSSRDMPMPVSRMVMVRASLSQLTSMRSSASPDSRPGLAIDSKRSLSQASEALEISSRRKISLCEYSEWVTRCRTWATSASNARVSARVSVFVVMEFLDRAERMARICARRRGIQVRRAPAREAGTGAARRQRSVRSFAWPAAGIARDAGRHPPCQPRIRRRRLPEHPSELAGELRHAFVADRMRRAARARALRVHQPPRLDQPQLLLELQRRQRGDRLEMLVEGRGAHAGLRGEALHRDRLR